MPDPIGHPGRQCRDCEFFDIGGEDEIGHSDCLNRRSPRFQTYAHWTCTKWTASTTGGREMREA